MPTPLQINAAAAQLNAQTGTDKNKLTSDAQADLLTFLRKYLYDTKRAGGYTLIPEKLAAAEGRQAAQLQAVLNNVGGVGSKVATLQGEVNYSTQENINNELEFALFVMYQPVAAITMGSKPSDIAVAIRSEFARPYGTCGCGDEYQKTRCND